MKAKENRFEWKDIKEIWNSPTTIGVAFFMLFMGLVFGFFIRSCPK